MEEIYFPRRAHFDLEPVLFPNSIVLVEMIGNGPPTTPTIILLLLAIAPSSAGSIHQMMTCRWIGINRGFPEFLSLFHAESIQVHVGTGLVVNGVPFNPTGEPIVAHATLDRAYPPHCYVQYPSLIQTILLFKTNYTGLSLLVGVAYMCGLEGGYGWRATRLATTLFLPDEKNAVRFTVERPLLAEQGLDSRGGKTGGGHVSDHRPGFKCSSRLHVWASVDREREWAEVTFQGLQLAPFIPLGEQLDAEEGGCGVGHTRGLIGSGHASHFRLPPLQQ